MLILAAAATLNGVTGCSSSGGGHASNGPATTIGIPTSVANNVGLRAQTELTGCASEPGGWSASGMAVNPGKKATKYTITIFFTTSEATVESYGTTTVEVPGGKSGEWKASALFQADPTTVCVLRGVS